MKDLKMALEVLVKDAKEMLAKYPDTAKLIVKRGHLVVEETLLSPTTTTPTTATTTPVASTN